MSYSLTDLFQAYDQRLSNYEQGEEEKRAED
jgi:hypothetical protein